MKCSWTGSSGAGCDAEALVNDPQGRCWFHSDTNEESRQEARRRGGRASARGPLGAPVQVDVSSPEKALETLSATAQALADGKTDRSTANSIFYAIATSPQVHRLASYERRLRAVEVKLQLRDPEDE